MLEEFNHSGFNLYPTTETGNTDLDHSAFVAKVTVLPSGINTYDRSANLQALLTLGKAFERQLLSRLPHAAVDEVTDILETLAIVRGQIHRTEQQLAEVAA